MSNLIKILLILSLVVNYIFGSDTVENAKDKLRVHEIISKTMRFDNYLTKDIHNEFWIIVNKHMKMNATQLKDLKLIVTANSLEYMRYYYEDMLVSMQEHRLFKSLDRENLEKFLLKNKLTSEWRIKDNDVIIQKVIDGVPIVDKDGNKFLFTKDIIFGALSRLDDIKKRVDKLFTRH